MLEYPDSIAGRANYIRRNGRAGGHAKYQCQGCGHQARFTPAAVAKAVQYAQVDELLSERNSQRSIARIKIGR
ncbi:hypothetical protein DDQ68_09575 [Hymenobacter nivis]|uniref:Uncharacterized protein n=1 Tax=Hymenobacter nivis TaxID=1850093 RepID=A0A2Z3GH74_9BACT|nr:hypothetical protein DDQ68_09575 [Hymenobacter nivis]